MSDDLLASYERAFTNCQWLTTQLERPSPSWLWRIR